MLANDLRQNAAMERRDMLNVSLPVQCRAAVAVQIVLARDDRGGAAVRAFPCRFGRRGTIPAIRRRGGKAATGR